MNLYVVFHTLQNPATERIIETHRSIQSLGYLKL